MFLLTTNLHTAFMQTDLGWPWSDNQSHHYSQVSFCWSFT